MYAHMKNAYAYVYVYASVLLSQALLYNCIIVLLHYCFMESIRGILYWDSPLIPINTPVFHIHGFSRDF